MRHGPEFLPDGKVAFRLWAPSAASVSLILGEGQPLAMQDSGNGWKERVEPAEAGQTYRFQIDCALCVPDPASRFQPEGVHGSSELIAPSSPAAASWKDRPWEEIVIYELHVGTFSPEGTYDGVEAKLDHLRSLGITAIELMPIADFDGKRGWGYDGVLAYAPVSAYGRPEDLKRLIAAAHAREIMVFLDVVYNHFGPSGNYLHAYAKPFFTKDYANPWGEAIDFRQKPVRQFFLQNALYWLEEYGFDGLRLDAVHAIADTSEAHFLKELAENVRGKLSKDRHIHLILENEHHESHYLERHFNGQWNDDMHHVLHVLLTGENHAYYQYYTKHLMDHLGHCLAYGFADHEGTPLYRKSNPQVALASLLPPTVSIAFIQNHDQVGNRAAGDRLTSVIAKEKLSLAYAVLLLSPHIPLLFMGEEWGSRTPFLYFCDFEGELAEAVHKGRCREFEFSECIDPNSPDNFIHSILNWEDLAQQEYQAHLEKMRALLELRREHLWPLLKTRYERAVYTVIDQRALDVRWEFQDKRILRLRVNLSDRPLEAADTVSGTILWGEDGNILSPWSCVWSIGDV